MEFEVGEILKDKITGFEGVVLGRTEYHTGCNHYGLQSKSLKDGKPIDWEWFDETRLMHVEGSEKMLQETRKPTSGPHPNAPQM